jgi:hypothetical protein
MPTLMQAPREVVAALQRKLDDAECGVQYDLRLEGLSAEHKRQIKVAKDKEGRSEGSIRVSGPVTKYADPGDLSKDGFLRRPEAVAKAVLSMITSRDADEDAGPGGGGPGGPGGPGGGGAGGAGGAGGSYWVAYGYGAVAMPPVGYYGMAAPAGTGMVTGPYYSMSEAAASYDGPSTSAAAGPPAAAAGAGAGAAPCGGAAPLQRAHSYPQGGAMGPPAAAAAYPGAGLLPMAPPPQQQQQHYQQQQQPQLGHAEVLPPTAAFPQQQQQQQQQHFGGKCLAATAPAIAAVTAPPLPAVPMGAGGAFAHQGQQQAQAQHQQQLHQQQQQRQQQWAASGSVAGTSDCGGPAGYNNAVGDRAGSGDGAAAVAATAAAGAPPAVMGPAAAAAAAAAGAPLDHDHELLTPLLPDTPFDALSPGPAAALEARDWATWGESADAPPGGADAGGAPQGASALIVPAPVLPAAPQGAAVAVAAGHSNRSPDSYPDVSVVHTSLQPGASAFAANAGAAGSPRGAPAAPPPLPPPPASAAARLLASPVMRRGPPAAACDLARGPSCIDEYSRLSDEQLEELAWETAGRLDAMHAALYMRDVKRREAARGGGGGGGNNSGAAIAAAKRLRVGL